MDSLPILGIGAATALGAGADSLREGLAGTRRPTIENETVATPAGDVIVPVYRASDDGLDQFVPRRALRRIDHFSRTALLAAHLAFRDAGIAPDAMSGRIGVVFGSAFGPLATTFLFQDTVIDDGDKCASPTAFANSVHNALASQVSINMKLSGPCTTITTFESTVAGVFDTARIWLERDIVDAVLVGVGEDYSPVVGYSLARDATRWPSEMRPLDFENCTYLPGEGFVTFLLGKPHVSAPFGRLGAVECFAPGENVTPLGERAAYLAASGDRAIAAAWSRCLTPGVTTTAHTPLVGSMPTGLAFEVAFAAVDAADRVARPGALEKGDAPPYEWSDAVALDSGDRIACYGADADGTIARLSVEVADA